MKHTHHTRRKKTFKFSLACLFLPREKKINCDSDIEKLLLLFQILLLVLLVLPRRHRSLFSPNLNQDSECENKCLCFQCLFKFVHERFGNNNQIRKKNTTRKLCDEMLLDKYRTVHVILAVFLPCLF